MHAQKPHGRFPNRVARTFRLTEVSVRRDQTELWLRLSRRQLKEFGLSESPARPSNVAFRTVLAALAAVGKLLVVRWLLAGRQGFEPRYRGPEPRVLPLDDLPVPAAARRRVRTFNYSPIQTRTGAKARVSGTKRH